MVRPDSEAQETDSHARPGDKGIAENRFAREDGQYLGDHTKGRQDENVHLGMAKRPEEMLPEQWISSSSELVKMRAQVTIEQLQDAGSCEAGNREEQQERCYQGHPRKQWHTVNRHTRRAHLENSDHKIERASYRRNTQEEYTQQPEILVQARRTHDSVTAIRGQLT